MTLTFVHRVLRPGIPASLVLLLAACGASDPGHDAVGQLQSDRVELVAEFAEPIVDRLLAEGQPVSREQVILLLDPTRIDARIDEQTARLRRADARLAELVRGPRPETIAAARANVEGGRKDLAFRETELQRVQSLLARELGTPDAVDRARADLDRARAQLDADEARLAELLAGTTSEELAQAEAAVQEARAALESLQIDRSRHDIRAPVDGVLDSLPFETGERAMAGQPVAVLLGGRQPHALVYVPAEHRPAIRAGSPASVRVDGVENPIEGRVRWVASDAAYTPYFALTERDRGHLTYAAKIDLEHSGERLPDGLPVEVTFPDLERHASGAR